MAACSVARGGHPKRYKEWQTGPSDAVYAEWSLRQREGQIGFFKSHRLLRDAEDYKIFIRFFFLSAISGPVEADAPVRRSVSSGIDHLVLGLRDRRAGRRSRMGGEEISLRCQSFVLQRQHGNIQLGGSDPDLCKPPVNYEDTSDAERMFTILSLAFAAPQDLVALF